MGDLFDLPGGSGLHTLATALPPPVVELQAQCAADHVPSMAPDALRVVTWLAALLPARRTFEIGTGYGVSGLAIALEAGPAHTLFTVERDTARAAVARTRFAEAGLGTRANVMVGEAARLVHKVSGPFDLVVLDGDTPVYEHVLDRLVALLRPGGILVSELDQRPQHGAPESGTPDSGKTDPVGRYAACLAGDRRLRTVFLPVGHGLALSIRVEGRT